jgi:hypothetical protein
MQAQGSDLPAAEILTPTPPPPIGSVQALGLSDVLRVELKPCQVAGFADELAEMRGPLGEAYESAREHRLTTSRFSASGSVLVGAEEKLSAAAYALRVHAAMTSQMPLTPIDEPLVVVGPATAISEIIDGAARNAADEVAGLMRRSPTRPVELPAMLRDRAAVLAAWIETYIDCHVVEWYRFDPNWDPVEAVI